MTNEKTANASVKTEMRVAGQTFEFGVQLNKDAFNDIKTMVNHIAKGFTSVEGVSDRIGTLLDSSIFDRKTRFEVAMGLANGFKSMSKHDGDIFNFAYAFSLVMQA